MLFALFGKALFLQLVLVGFFGRGEREGLGMFGCGSGVWKCILQMWNGWGIVGSGGACVWDGCLYGLGWE